MQINDLNKATISEAYKRFLLCCSSNTWAEKLVAARPFSSAGELLSAADAAWKNLGENDYLQAFDGHPKIGDVSSLKEKYASTKALASNEQASVAHTSDGVINKLAQKNTEYLEKFGFIFIVCATGKTAPEMLDLLIARLPNSRALELKNAAEEQRKIFRLRLKKLIEEQGSPVSPITTHILDTAIGKPASNVLVKLEHKVGQKWVELANKPTDENGRINDFLTDTSSVDAGHYRLNFDTSAYFESQSQHGLYPYVEIVFEISDAQSGEHFHIPLLISPFSYSTYRGS